MKGGLTENTQWVAVLAARLRLLQSSFADDLPDNREQALNEELEQALRTVSQGKRKKCLEDLAAEFPVPASVESGYAGASATEQAAIPDDPAILVERLLDLLPTMTPERRADISAQLQSSGLLPPG